MAVARSAGLSRLLKRPDGSAQARCRGGPVQVRLASGPAGHQLDGAVEGEEGALHAGCNAGGDCEADVEVAALLDGKMLSHRPLYSSPIRAI
jgi:hypothetical protein